MVSKNGVALITYLLAFAGFEVAENDVAQFAAAVVQAISFLVLLYNQWDRWDVKGFIWKK